ncbi:hypothetical protein BBW65_05170 [Helicobacter enhydrae]|uniref:Membrane transport protein MMPL domain-containing protein n=1 Tax=Helicobacter enhydrae TaxID=222136 RepID=A0A1B1U606_9HELI|nr:hypothetical protein [Helicobacter enhydrae]ANV98227.1 hypothetical protein BBW65_05170 [Helicobacter enhydrae]
MKKTINFLILLCVALCFAVLWGDKISPKQISLEVLDLFPKTQERKLVDLYRKFNDAKYIFVSQDVAQEEFDAFLSRVQKLPNVEKIIKEGNPALEEYIKQHYFYMGDFVPRQMESEEMVRKFENDLGLEINPLDPLGFVRIDNTKKELKVGAVPFVLVVMQDSDAKEVKRLYDAFVPLAEEYHITHYFAPLFMETENPQLILKEVNLLMGVVGLCFVVLYFVMLRMPLLTLNMIVTLIVSNAFAMGVLLLVYPQVSIMALSFGMGISNICVDYLLHHHFLRFYCVGKVRFNLPVFYGFITTMSGFVVCLFVPFPLLNQLSLYAIVNLAIAYLCFGFLYQWIGFGEPKYYGILRRMGFNKIPTFVFVGLALLLGGYGVFHLQTEMDLSKLDYQNPQMNAQKAYFLDFDSNHKDFIVSAHSIDELITRAREIKHLIPNAHIPLALMPTQSEIKKRIRFLKSVSYRRFQKQYKRALYEIRKQMPDLYMLLANSYASIPPYMQQPNLQTLVGLGFNIIKENGNYYYQGKVESENLVRLEYIDGVYVAQLPDLIARITSGIYAPMVSILGLAFLAMLVILLIATRNRFFDALSFVIFPFACVMFYLSLNGVINIMHLFALLILVVVSVDYGVYHIQEGDSLETRHAILFSVLTTLSSFGVFMFSDTRALYSFGQVIFVGMLCVIGLILLQQKV